MVTLNKQLQDRPQTKLFDIFTCFYDNISSIIWKMTVKSFFCFIVFIRANAEVIKRQVVT